MRERLVDLSETQTKKILLFIKAFQKHRDGDASYESRIYTVPDSKRLQKDGDFYNSAVFHKKLPETLSFPLRLFSSLYNDWNGYGRDQNDEKDNNNNHQLLIFPKVLLFNPFRSALKR